VTSPPHFHRPRRRGWFAPVLNFFDRVNYSWWRFKRGFSGLFNFHWLGTQLSMFGHYFMAGCRYPFLIIGWLLRQGWSVLTAWWQIRNFRYLIQGLPALAGIILITVIAVYTALRSSEGLQEHYLRQAADARMRGEKQKEQLCFERLMQVQSTGDPRRQETQYALARVSGELLHRQRARFLLAELANPDNDEGLPLAHYDRARSILNEGVKSRQDIELIERHLRRALNKQPDFKEANALMGILLADLGRHDEAITYLVKTELTDINARMTLARIYKIRGDDNRAEMYAKPVIDHIFELVQNNIDDVNANWKLSECYRILNDFEKAITTLEQAYSKKKSEFYRIQLSNCYISWYEFLERMPPSPIREQRKLDLLLKALDWDKTNVEALKHFVNFMSPNGSFAPERDDAHKVMLSLRGNNPYLHLWLGQKLFTQGKNEEAKKEWELAYQLYPDSPIIANNFAWILTHGSPPKSREGSYLVPDLSRALKMIDQVLEKTPKEHPNRFQFHGTRGTIYLKMGRFQEAREDLVIASQGPQAANDAILQQQLVEVYERLGMPTLRDAHRKRLEEIYRRNNREGQAPGN
jgi:tetratricopeptide (TPR) repeat protein